MASTMLPNIRTSPLSPQEYRGPFAHFFAFFRYFFLTPSSPPVRLPAFASPRDAAAGTVRLSDL